jgi:hypothetical protein
MRRHPEAGLARRGTSQALKRFRESERDYVRMDAIRRLRGLSCNCEVPRPAMAGLGMTRAKLTRRLSAARTLPDISRRSCR